VTDYVYSRTTGHSQSSFPLGDSLFLPFRVLSIFSPFQPLRPEGTGRSPEQMSRHGSSNYGTFKLTFPLQDVLSPSFPNSQARHSAALQWWWSRRDDSKLDPKATCRTKQTLKRGPGLPGRRRRLQALTGMGTIERNRVVVSTAATQPERPYAHPSRRAYRFPVAR
jgi:hypothetical protein